MGIYVGPSGPISATIAFVGEGPGRDELIKGRPFVGPTGHELDGLLRDAGLNRSEVFLTNVERTTLTKPDHARQIECAIELVREFEKMPNLNVIVPLGAVALGVLGGWKYDSIAHYRGSILESFFGTKIVPTYHPAFYMRGEWRFKPVVLADITRAIEQSKYPEMKLPQRRYHIEPTYADAIEWLHHLLSAEELAVDIETTGWGYGGTYVSCIGFAPSTMEAYCIPITRGKAPYWTKDQELQIWRAIHRLLGASSKKYLQNCMFDVRVLNAHYVKVNNVYHDTMLAHHLLYPELPHGLDFISSIYTEEPYYKEDRKTWSQFQDFRVLWNYNCKDCVTTLESGHELEKELQEANMFEYFHDYIMALIWPLMDMERVGIRVDKECLVRLTEWLEADYAFKQEELNKKAGFEVNVKSSKDIARLLLENGIRITKTTPKGAPKLDEESIREYCRQASANRGVDVTIGDEALAIREKRTLLSNFVDITTDDEDYYHFSMLIHGTQTGRLSSRAPRNSDNEPLGPQMQNIPLECRGVFCAAPGKILISSDLKQAEAVFVAYDAQDEMMMKQFEPGGDIHYFNASNIFKKPREQVTYLERWIAKRVVHGFDYGMGPRRVLGVLIKDGFYITEAQAKQIQNAYFAACPAIPGWQQRIADQVRLTKTLTSPLGRRRVFLGNYDDNMMRAALSQNPQSVVADITNRGIIKLYESLPSHARVVLQVHDEIVIECDEDKYEEITPLVRDALTLPIPIHGRVMTIGVDIKVGKHWAQGMKEVK